MRGSVRRLNRGSLPPDAGEWTGLCLYLCLCTALQQKLQIQEYFEPHLYLCLCPAWQHRASDLWVLWTLSVYSIQGPAILFLRCHWQRSTPHTTLISTPLLAMTFCSIFNLKADIITINLWTPRQWRLHIHVWSLDFNTDINVNISEQIRGWGTEPLL